MNSLNFKIVKSYIKPFIRAGVFFFCFFTHVSLKAWEVDLSRRQRDMRTLRMPASVVDQPAAETAKEGNVFSGFFEVTEPTQEIVILNTVNGFVPETVRLKKGGNYRVHVVNVNEKEKNSSFILDAFSEHHATFFGQQKSFQITPKVDGIFSFISPETGKQGRLVVTPNDGDRKPAATANSH